MSLWKLLTATYDGTNDAKVRIDASTSSMQTIEYEHHEVHGGSMFHYDIVRDVGNGASTTDIVVAPASTAELHLLIGMDVEGEALLSCYEGVTVAASGTAATFRNHNRWSTSSGTALLYTGADISATGTSLIFNLHAGSGKKTGGEDRGQNEWILKSGTVYSFVFVNESGANNNTILEWDWYEHTPHN